MKKILLTILSTIIFERSEAFESNLGFEFSTDFCKVYDNEADTLVPQALDICVSNPSITNQKMEDKTQISRFSRKRLSFEDIKKLNKLAEEQANKYGTKRKIKLGEIFSVLPSRSPKSARVKYFKCLDDKKISLKPPRKRWSLEDLEKLNKFAEEQINKYGTEKKIKWGEIVSVLPDRPAVSARFKYFEYGAKKTISTKSNKPWSSEDLEKLNKFAEEQINKYGTKRKINWREIVMVLPERSPMSARVKYYGY